MSRSPLAVAFAVVPTLVLGASTGDEDLKLARSLMRPGYDLVGVQQRLIGGEPYAKDWLHERERTHLVIRDLNGDSLKDVFMAVEENPRILGEEEHAGEACEMPSRVGERQVCWGERAIEVHYQQPDGTYRLGTRTSKLMMGRDEGGMDPDPFKGFTLTPKGAIRIHFDGGSGWVWKYMYTVQFRKDDVYVVGTYEYSCNMAGAECYEAEANLLTGQWRRESWFLEDGKPRRSRRGVAKAVRPYRLQDAFVRMDPCAPPPRPDYDPDVHVSGGPREGFSCHEPTR